MENVLTQQAKVLEEIGIYPHGGNSGTLSRTSRSCSVSSLVSTMSSIGDGVSEVDVMCCPFVSLFLKFSLQAHKHSLTFSSLVNLHRPKLS